MFLKTNSVMNRSIGGMCSTPNLQRAAGILALLSAAACLPDKPGPTGVAVVTQAPSALSDSAAQRLVVMLDTGVADVLGIVKIFESEHGGRHAYIYQHIKGFAIDGLSAQAVEALRRHPLVRGAAPSRNVSVATDYDLGGLAGTWGLDRVDSRPRSYDGFYRPNGDGLGSHIYIIDSGVRGDHVEFSGRVGNGVGFISWYPGDKDPYRDECSPAGWGPVGHGTGTAAAAAGATTGAARSATIHSVRVSGNDCRANTSDQIAGIDWVAGNAIAPAVLNLSIAGTDPAVGDALVRAQRSGNVVAVKAAGNDNRVECSGGNNPDATIVGATDGSDAMAAFSNFGSCVNMWAPGQDIRTASRNGASDYFLATGTSFASPLVAGGAAVLRARFPAATATEIKQLLYAMATKNVVSGGLSGAQNALLYVAAEGGAIVTGPVGQVISNYYPGTRTWTAKPFGGTGWTYVWEESIDGGPYQVVSTSSSYSKTIAGGSVYNLYLRLTGTSSTGEVSVARGGVQVMVCQKPFVDPMTCTWSTK